MEYSVLKEILASSTIDNLIDNIYYGNINIWEQLPNYRASNPIYDERDKLSLSILKMLKSEEGIRRYEEFIKDDVDSRVKEHKFCLAEGIKIGIEIGLLIAEENRRSDKNVE